MQPSDTSTIDALFHAYGEAWRANDMARWAALFTPDADFVTWRGLRWHTRQRIALEHEAIPPHVAAQMPRYTLAIDEVQALEDHLALAHGRWAWPGFTEQAGNPPEDRTGALTMLLQQRDGRWGIRASHNCRTDDVA